MIRSWEQWLVFVKCKPNKIHKESPLYQRLRNRPFGFEVNNKTKETLFHERGERHKKPQADLLNSMGHNSFWAGLLPAVWSSHA